jgi:hypothetical protein
MKKIAILAILLTGFGFVHSQAQAYKTALGVRLSTAGAAVNNSVSLKHFIKERVALEALVTISDRPAVGVLFEVHNPIASAEGLQWFWGAGGYVGFNAQKDIANRQLLGAQGVVGLDYKFTNLPLNLSIDWKPELNIVDNINFEPSAIGLTMRFTFGAR